MRNLLKGFLEGKENEIYNETMRFMIKYGVDSTFRNRTFLESCIIDTNNGIFNPCDENIKVITQNISLRIIKLYSKDDLQDEVYDVIKCFENGYRVYLLGNIEDKEILNECIMLIDQFFYNYEKLITKNSHLTNRFKFFIKKDEINLLIDNVPAIVILKDANKKWIFANKYAEKCYGLKEDYIGKTDKELSEYNKYIRESISSQYKKRDIWTSNKSYFYEESITKNNRKMFLFVTEIPMVFENGSKVIIVIKNDVTRNKVAKQKIYEDESNYIKIFDNISDAISICKADRILYLNKKAMKIMGYIESESLIGKDINSFVEISPKLIEYGDYTAKKLVYEGENIKNRSTVKRKLDGKVFDMRMLSLPFLYENQNAILTIASCNNDTKDNIIKYGKTKSEFIGKISHELRTPLNVILSALQVIGLYDGCRDLDEQCMAYKKYYYMIKQNSYRLLRIVNNFMDVNEIEDGVSKLNFTRENIVSIVEDVTMVAAEFVNHKGKNIVFDTDVEEKIMLVDKDGIQKVILNLLSNAIKFTGRSAKIEVNVHSDNDNIIISVKDNGIGIPKSKQKVIFERFVQLDKTFTRQREGSGMGLLIVKMIVKLHNGWITVNSEPGHGSEFIVTLPVLDSKIPENDHKENVIKFSNEEKVNLEFSDLIF